jgi:hypothetical protein
MKKQLIIKLSITLLLDFFAILNPIHSQELVKKWFPGHYVAIRHLTNPVNESGRNLVKDNAYIEGYKMHVVWNELEPVKDQYNFAIIQNVLKIAESDGKKLLIHLQDRKFGVNANPFLPDYMLTSEYEGGWYYSTETGASYGNIWLEAYQLRWNKLLKALGEAVDNNPTVAGIIVSESSMNTNTPGYDKTGHLKFITSMHTTMATYAPKTIFFQYVNWGFTADERDVLMKHIVEVCHNGFGGPDIYDGKSPDKNKTWTLDMRFGTYYNKYRGITAYSVENQSGGYKEPASARQVFDYAVDQIGVHFLPWAIYNATDRAYTFKDDVLPLINQEKGRINTTPPSNITRTGVSNNHSTSGKYSIYPNPAKDMLILNLKGESLAGSLTWQLMDITGKVIDSQLVNNSATIISTSQLIKGTYILKITDKQMNSENLKFIKI